MYECVSECCGVGSEDEKSMIHNQDRSGWFGASDTARIMGNWNTQTFARWWGEKLGMFSNDFKTPAMMAGTAYEHRILDAIGIRQRDRQIRRWILRLRVNLDGETPDMVHEVKTYSAEHFRVSTAYWMQCQVEMYASGKKCRIVAYQLTDEDYKNYFNPIDENRLSYWPIEYNSDWVEGEYLPRLRYLARCLKRRDTPDGEVFRKNNCCSKIDADG